MDAQTEEEFAKLHSIEGNNVCIDCNASNPKWASVNNGCFMCIDCAGNHRSMGVHISFVRSTTMDTWSLIQLNRMKHGGNEKLIKFWTEQKFFKKEHKLTPKERLDNEAMDKYRQNLLKMAKNEKVECIPFIGYKRRQIMVKNTQNMKGIGSNFDPNQKRNKPRKSQSKLGRYAIKATMALTGTSATDEPEEITNYKKLFKHHKHWTLEMEEIVNNLYNAQNAYAQTMQCFNEYTTQNMQIIDKEDKFSIFCKNMGQRMKSLDEIYEVYLLNMEDNLLKPLHGFNKEQIKKTQRLKVDLKTVKGKYDISTKRRSISLSRDHEESSNKELNKFNDLQLVRNDFILGVQKMQQFRINELLPSIKSYFESFAALVSTQSHNMGQNMDAMYQNDANSQQHMHNDQHMIIKQGWMNKRGGGHKSSKFKRRFFKFFTNKKLAYYTKENHVSARGHAVLTFLQMKKMENNCFSIQTKDRLWVFGCDTLQERDDWFDCIERRCIKDQHENDGLLPVLHPQMHDVYSADEME